MIFNNQFSKFGKGENISAIMPSENSISIFYYLGGIGKKQVEINDDNISLKKEKVSLPYFEVIALDENYIITRIDKSLAVNKL